MRSFDDPYFFAPGLGAGFAGCPLLAIFAVPPFVIGFRLFNRRYEAYFFAPGLGAGFAGCPFWLILHLLAQRSKVNRASPPFLTPATRS
jgi:hypothetical protein